MKLIKLPALFAAVLCVLALVPANAPAANVTIGNPLSGTFQFVILGCPQAFPFCTVGFAALPNATLTSPIDGAIVRWRIRGGSEGKQYRLRVLTPAGNGFTSGQTTAPASPAGSGLETFESALPIKAGQTIGLDLEPGAGVIVGPLAGGRLMMFRPQLTEGQTQTPTLGIADQTAGFNAEIQPAPTVSGMNPAEGPRRGGNQIEIAGADLLGASAVRFGNVASTKFKVSSATSLSAVVPPSASAANVPVTVTTPAGTATAPGTYAYKVTPEEEVLKFPPPGGKSSICNVPKLRGKRLAAAKKALKRVHCAAGKVRHKSSGRALRGRVLAQKPAAGKAVPAGTKVTLTVGR